MTGIRYIDTPLLFTPPSHPLKAFGRKLRTEVLVPNDALPRATPPRSRPLQNAAIQTRVTYRNSKSVTYRVIYIPG